MGLGSSSPEELQRQKERKEENKRLSKISAQHFKILKIPL